MDLSLITNYIGVAFGIISVGLSVYLYRKSKESKDPLLHYRTYRDIIKLSSTDNPNIRIHYKSEEVDRVFTTYVWFWNAGKRPINRADIPPQAGLRLQLTDPSQKLAILDYRIIRPSRDAVNFTVSRVDDTSLALQFDFLDYQDGVVIEIQHTGSYRTTVTLEGIVLGAPEGVKIVQVERGRQRIGEDRDENPRSFTRRPFVVKVWQARFDLLVGILGLALFIAIIYWLQIGPGSTDPLYLVRASRVQTAIATMMPGTPQESSRRILHRLELEGSTVFTSSTVITNTNADILVRYKDLRDAFATAVPGTSVDEQQRFLQSLVKVSENDVPEAFITARDFRRVL